MEKKCHWCGGEPNYYFKTSFRYCCQPVYSKCPVYREKTRQKALKRGENSRKRTMERDIPHQKCERCGRPAKFVIGQNQYQRYSCSEKAFDCPAQSNWVSDMRRRSFENRANVLKGRTRPEHSEALLTDNKFGSKGQTGYYHKLARQLWWKSTCQICGKSEEEQLAEFGKGLHMHCRSENWTDLSEENWRVECHACHRRTHPHSNKSRRQISTSNMGRIVSEETRRRISESNIGKKRSEESKKNMSVAAKLRWRKEKKKGG